jgi:hypothetical protein
MVELVLQTSGSLREEKKISAYIWCMYQNCMLSSSLVAVVVVSAVGVGVAGVASCLRRRYFHHRHLSVLPYTVDLYAWTKQVNVEYLYKIMK